METNNTITATEAIRSFSDIINKVYYQHQTFDIKKGKSIVARIVPYNYSSKIEVKDLVSFFALKTYKAYHNYFYLVMF